MSREYDVKNEVALKLVSMCGKTGVLEAADNSKLSGDVKTRHSNAMKECERFKDENGHVDPNIQAIFARIYGLI